MRVKEESLFLLEIVLPLTQTSHSVPLFISYIRVFNTLLNSTFFEVITDQTNSLLLLLLLFLFSLLLVLLSQLIQREIFRPCSHILKHLQIFKWHCFQFLIHYHTQTHFIVYHSTYLATEKLTELLHLFDHFIVYMISVVFKGLKIFLLLFDDRNLNSIGLDEIDVFDDGLELVIHVYG